MDPSKHGYMLIDNTYRYNLNEILSYGRFLNMIYGGRGIGKTYAAKKWCTSRFENYGERFIYIRRHDTDLVNMESFFNDFTGTEESKKEHWSVNPKKKEKTFLCDGEVGGYYGSYTSLSRKSIVFENLVNVVIDEFMTLEGQRYWKDEFNSKFLTVIDTLNRFACNNMRVIMLANNTSLYNPYFLEIGYTGYAPGEFWAPKQKGPLLPGETGFKYHTVVQRVETDERLKAAFRASVFGQFIEGSDYAQHSIENRSLIDKNEFISKKTGDCMSMCNFYVDGNIYSLWCSAKTGFLYVCSGMSDARVTYSACESSDFRVGTYSIYALKKDERYQVLVDAYNTGRLFYENNRCKNAAFKMMRNIMRI